jgi:hypothetical protein
VDQEGNALDILVQRQRDKQAAKREMLPAVEHRQHRSRDTAVMQHLARHHRTSHRSQGSPTRAAGLPPANYACRQGTIRQCLGYILKGNTVVRRLYPVNMFSGTALKAAVAPILQVQFRLRPALAGFVHYSQRFMHQGKRNPFTGATAGKVSAP